MDNVDQPNIDKPKPIMCGFSYRSQPYGGGSRYHCPNCDIRDNGYGLTFINWTNGHTRRRYCTNPVIHNTNI